jgi:hypothetical protein
LKAYPEDGDLMQPLTSRITLFFSDEIDIDTMTAESIIVRPVDGEAIDGVFSHSSFNAVSFGAKDALLADTTYEVVIVSGGLADLAQNPIGEETVTRFSTGSTIQEPMGGGGSGNMAGSGGGSGAPSAGGPAMGGSSSGGGPPASGGDEPLGNAGTLAADPSDAPQDSGGCGCTVPGGTPSRGGLAALLALGALGLASRAGRRSRKRGTLRP